MILSNVLTENEVLELEHITSSGEVSFLVLHNDDINTFDHVISCLVEICDHELQQAEQCALIVHTKGKAVVKTAGQELLRPMKRALLEAGLTVTIETEKVSK